MGEVLEDMMTKASHERVEEYVGQGVSVRRKSITIMAVTCDCVHERSETGPLSWRQPEKHIYSTARLMTEC